MGNDTNDDASPGASSRPSSAASSSASATHRTAVASVRELADDIAVPHLEHCPDAYDRIAAHAVAAAAPATPEATKAAPPTAHTSAIATTTTTHRRRPTTYFATFKSAHPPTPDLQTRIDDRPDWADDPNNPFGERLWRWYGLNSRHADIYFRINDGGDTTIDDDSRLIPAHSMVIGLVSPMLERLCYGPDANADPRGRILNVPAGLSPAAFYVWLRFAYGDGSTPAYLNQDNVYDVLLLAEHFEFHLLVACCHRLLESCISVENACHKYAELWATTEEQRAECEQSLRAHAAECDCAQRPPGQQCRVVTEMLAWATQRLPTSLRCEQLLVDKAEHYLGNRELMRLPDGALSAVFEAIDARQPTTVCPLKVLAALLCWANEQLDERDRTPASRRRVLVDNPCRMRLFRPQRLDVGELARCVQLAGEGFFDAGDLGAAFKTATLRRSYTTQYKYIINGCQCGKHEADDGRRAARMRDGRCCYKARRLTFSAPIERKPVPLGADRSLWQLVEANERHPLAVYANVRPQPVGRLEARVSLQARQRSPEPFVNVMQSRVCGGAPAPAPVCVGPPPPGLKAAEQPRMQVRKSEEEGEEWVWAPEIIALPAAPPAIDPLQAADEGEQPKMADDDEPSAAAEEEMIPSPPPRPRRKQPADGGDPAPDESGAAGAGARSQSQ